MYPIMITTKDNMASILAMLHFETFTITPVNDYFSLLSLLLSVNGLSSSVQWCIGLCVLIEVNTAFMEREY